MNSINTELVDIQIYLSEEAPIVSMEAYVITNGDEGRETDLGHTLAYAESSVYSESVDGDQWVETSREDSSNPQHGIPAEIWETFLNKAFNALDSLVE